MLEANARACDCVANNGNYEGTLKEYGRVRERTKAVTASTYVLAVKNYLNIEVLSDYMFYGLFFLFTAGQASLSLL